MRCEQHVHAIERAGLDTALAGLLQGKVWRSELSLASLGFCKPIKRESQLRLLFGGRAGNGHRADSDLVG